MKKMIKFPKIGQFNEIIQQVQRQATFVGLDENGDAIYDGLRPKPVITVKGTIKLHGTNAGVIYNAVDGIWYQSRENIITPTQDNAGMAFFASTRVDSFMRIIHQISIINQVDLNSNSICVYGEFAGKGIQKNVAISELDKAFYIFGVKISPFDENEKAYWVDSSNYHDEENRIFNIRSFQTFEVEVDFNKPKEVQNKFIEITEQVEKECPVAKHFGVSSIGEGVVWSFSYGDSHYRFKTKGLLHAGKSKVKVLKPVDNERLAKIADVAEKVCVVWRLDQMLTKACDLLNGGTIERKKLGDYIKLVIADVVEEESNTIVEAGFELKDIAPEISKIAKNYFFEKENEQVGL